eukprot:14481464-Alexandrium_andersonii.AAC.1
MRGRSPEDQDPEVVAFAPQDHHRELVLVRRQRYLVEGVHDVRAKEADLVDAVGPEEMDRVAGDVGNPRGGDALALADHPVDQRAPEVPDDAVLRGAAGAHLGDHGKL